MKKLIAYSSVAHMGFVTLGIFTFTTQGVEGAHLPDGLARHRLGRALPRASACSMTACIRARSPPTAASSNRMPIFAASSWCSRWPTSGCPAPAGFVGEFLTLLGAFKVNTWVAFLATSGVIWSAAYALYLYRRVIFGDAGEAEPEVDRGPDLARDRDHGAAGGADAAASASIRRPCSTWRRYRSRSSSRPTRPRCSRRRQL